MNRFALSEHLRNNHAAFLLQLQALDAAAFCYAPEGKWSAAQQLDHIIRSLKPVNRALGLPKFILRWQFGMANRPSKTYEQLVEKYKRKLQEGGRASGIFVPPPVNTESKETLVKTLSRLVGALCKKTETHTETALDRYILPHPLLGRITLREMLYFTSYHVEHHSQLVRTGLQQG